MSISSSIGLTDRDGHSWHNARSVMAKGEFYGLRGFSPSLDHCTGVDKPERAQDRGTEASERAITRGAARRRNMQPARV